MGFERAAAAPIREAGGPIRKAEAPIREAVESIREVEAPIREAVEPIREVEGSIQEAPRALQAAAGERPAQRAQPEAQTEDRRSSARTGRCSAPRA